MICISFAINTDRKIQSIVGFDLFINHVVTFQIKACGVAQLNLDVTARIIRTMEVITNFKGVIFQEV